MRIDFGVSEKAFLTNFTLETTIIRVPQFMIKQVFRMAEQLPAQLTTERTNFGM